MAEVHTLPRLEPPEKATFCLTATARHIFALLTASQRNGLLGVVLGESGCGKSTAITEFARVTQNVHLCRMPETAKGVQPGLLRVARTLGAAPLLGPNSGACELHLEIVNSLSIWGRPSTLLILDEAQHMSDELLEAVRDIYDEVGVNEPGFGVVLVGNPTLADRWAGQPGKRRTSSFAQLRGRIGAQLGPLPGPLPEDLEAICAHGGIAGQRARTFLQRIAKHPGRLHTVSNLLKVAQKLAGAEVALTFEHLEAAASVLGLSS